MHRVLTHSPTTKTLATQLRPARTSGYFVTNAGVNPVDYGGCVASVRRLVDGTARPFFRVRLKRVIDVDHASSAMTFSLRAPNPAVSDFTALRGAVTADPVTTKEADEFDIVLKTGGTAVDTAGVRFDLILSYDISPKG